MWYIHLFNYALIQNNFANFVRQIKAEEDLMEVK